ncbi:hypothetical protein, partial [Mesorhizobium sp.]|uniref:hypothetical protein n=1 Tax=Mesorhizobium sp. TaxID=1871066 RepID=UPI0025C15CC8
AQPDKPDFGGFFQGNQPISPKRSRTSRQAPCFEPASHCSCGCFEADPEPARMPVPARIRGCLFEFAASHLEFAAG